MKLKSILFFLSVLWGASPVLAQSVAEPFDISGVTVEREGDCVALSFRVEILEHTLPRGFSAVAVPVITDGRHRVSFTPLVAEGKRARVLRSRSEMAVGRPSDLEGVRRMDNRTGLHYRSMVEYQSWMEGAFVELEQASVACTTIESAPARLLAENLLYTPKAVEVPLNVPAEEPGFVPVSAGDTLSLAFTFVLPASEWKENEPIYDEDRENALIVYYRLNRDEIEPEYGNNRQILLNLVAAVNTIQHSANSDVKQVIVAGFSSPEGTFARNDRLAWNRAAVIKKYLVEQTGIDEKFITVYNGSEDWRGVRMMVAASDLYDKQQILEIIDRVPIVSTDGRQSLRLNRLKTLNGGVSYDYMLEHFFPKLRNGAFIRVYYQNR